VSGRKWRLKLKKTKTYEALYKEVWNLQSKYVCLRDKKCVTCGSEKHPQAGHYVHGKAMDFVEENIHRQCAHCNFYLHGNPVNYADFLITRYGAKILSKLLAIKKEKTGKKPTEAELLKLKTYFKRKLSSLEAK
jgi:hypothetical protein